MFKVLKKGCSPTRGTKYSACIDLYAAEDVVIGVGKTKVIGLGVCIDLEKLKDNEIFQSIQFSDCEDCDFSFNKDLFEKFLLSHYIELDPRSSLRGKSLVVGVGKIDLDYPDELKLIVHNPFTIKTVANVAIQWINKVLPIVGTDLFPYLKVKKEGFDETGAFAVNKAVGNKKASKIAQITMLEHQSYLFGIDTEVERISGIGSTDEH